MVMDVSLASLQIVQQVWSETSLYIHSSKSVIGVFSPTMSDYVDQPTLYEMGEEQRPHMWLIVCFNFAIPRQAGFIE